MWFIRYMQYSGTTARRAAGSWPPRRFFMPPVRHHFCPPPPIPSALPNSVKQAIYNITNTGNQK